MRVPPEISFEFRSLSLTAKGLAAVIVAAPLALLIVAGAATLIARLW